MGAVLLLTLCASTAYGWSAEQLHTATRASFTPRGRASLQALDASSSGAATGAEDIAKTDGIPNYMLRSTGTISRLAEGSGSSTAVQGDGVVLEQDQLVTILTSDVIDMVQQQGDTAEKVDYLGENILVEGLLFDDFAADDSFEITSDEVAEVVTLEIVEPRPSSALELGQVGDDDGKKQSIASILSLAPGFSGWTARVVVPGRVNAGYQIAKADAPEA